MTSSCKALTVKLTYTIITLIVFLFGLLLSFDFMMSSKKYLPESFDLTKELQYISPDLMEARIYTNIFQFGLAHGYYSDTHQCLSSTYKSSDKFYKSKVIQTEIYGSDEWHHEVLYISKQFIADNEVIFRKMHKIGLICTVVGFVCPAIIISLVWFCCANWCQCYNSKFGLCQPKFVRVEQVPLFDQVQVKVQPTQIHLPPQMI
ncbi:Hypothetical_protein [Hexamita inflata]|uniref:Hypothetical_protein n=1 Tax=Hexamita inflata TaxID=28002 RepID=A0AA86RH57_9EUKA|nr:Hypothetical protein HINF_LOCUS65586 [Hexamita inflata]